MRQITRNLQFAEQMLNIAKSRIPHLQNLHMRLKSETDMLLSKIQQEDLFGADKLETSSAVDYIRILEIRDMIADDNNKISSALSSYLSLTVEVLYLVASGKDDTPALTRHKIYRSLLTFNTVIHNTELANVPKDSIMALIARGESIARLTQEKELIAIRNLCKSIRYSLCQ